MLTTMRQEPEEKTMADRFDVVVLGMGAGGEVVSGKLLAAGAIHRDSSW